MPTPTRPSRSDLVGVLNVNKQPGWTSHDVVARVRRLSGQRRVGHAGTLDPPAEGVLPVLLGPATRLADLAQAGRKRYTAEVRLGTATTTDDAAGDPIATRPVPRLDRASVERALHDFRGEIRQRPPRYSAIKADGRRAYAIARRGGEPDLQPRPVTVHALELLWLEGDRLALEVECARGTYIRALARDLAVALGTVGHVTRLVRTRVGPLGLESALTLERLAELGIERALLPPDVLLGDAPTYPADADALRALLNGRPVAVAGLAAEHVRIQDEAGRLRLVGSADGRLLRPRITLVRESVYARVQ
jgi:tRNA pseudouridine55 synthase